MVSRALRYTLVIVFLLTVMPLVAAEIDVKKVDGRFGTSEMTPIGSGSGVLVGPRHVLTNRHVVINDHKEAQDGFNVLLPSDYKKSVTARVMCVCEQYDLALIELSEAVNSPKLPILTRLPSLGQKVKAYGFPTGADFGVGLTLTGGQVSRHPTDVPQNASSDRFSISSSLWHDAVITGGSSGGPLMSESGVLLGINRATLVKDKDHALAVPCTVVHSFLQATGIGLNATSVDTCATTSHSDKAKESVVFVEVLSSDANATEARIKYMSELGTALTEIIRNETMKRLASLSRQQLAKIRDGNVLPAFKPVSAVNISKGEVARIATRITIIQVLSEGLLVKIDGVKCLILTAGDDNAELAAKTGDRIIRNVPMNKLFVVGNAMPYETVAGTVAHYIVLFPVELVCSADEFAELVESELKRRYGRLSSSSGEDSSTDDCARYLSKIQHTFHDDTGKFSVDAAAVELDEEQVRLIRIEDSKRLTVPLQRLSENDREWLSRNAAWINVYGVRYEKAVERKNTTDSKSSNDSS